MPTHASIAPNRSQVQPEIDESNVACPLPLTPPPDQYVDPRPNRAFTQQDHPVTSEIFRRAVNDNTAVAMSESQEESMYTPEPEFEEKLHPEVPEEKMEADVLDDGSVSSTAAGHKLNADNQANECDNDENEAPASNPDEPSSVRHPSQDMEMSGTNPLPGNAKEVFEKGAAVSGPSTSVKKPGFSSPISSTGVPPIDRELDWSGHVKPWDFSGRRLRPQYPSATFQPYSVFKGTQQSDRQIYNVEVTILTVDVEQASMSGYLQICGLTPDHPTLTTFFTGEIIGGPDQKYSFRTGDSSWGASDKTDLTHWARFPAWRPLSLHAKRNINFVYPMNHEDWWQQEHIFMRWKEHFLVPDYKLKSIQGASFEGFYYICFNQVEGRVSGIYFHSKSEK